MFKLNVTLMLVVSFFSSSSYSQEIKFSGSVAGVGWVETAYSKKITTIRFFDFSYEKPFLVSWACSAGLGLSHLQYEGITNLSIEYFRERSFLTLPVMVRKYQRLSKQSVTYVELGFANKYELTDKIDYNSTIWKNEKFVAGGYVLNLVISGGFKTKLGRNTTFDLGIGGQKNGFSSYKKQENKIKPSASFLTMSFSKKIQNFKKTKK